MLSTTDIKDRLKQQPFTPFRIVTSSGEHYEVHHPDLLLVGVSDLIVGQASEKDPTAYERVNRIALMHVTALEDLPARQKASKGNGQGG